MSRSGPARMGEGQPPWGGEGGRPTPGDGGGGRLLPAEEGGGRGKAE